MCTEFTRLRDPVEPGVFYGPGMPELFLETSPRLNLQCLITLFQNTHTPLPFVNQNIFNTIVARWRSWFSNKAKPLGKEDSVDGHKIFTLCTWIMKLLGLDHR